LEIKKNLTTKNFDPGNISRVKYIVIHYTGNNGDTALNNTNYFKSYRGASAHYFVDENNVYQSIEDKNIAWHCGASKYYHSQCRNYNSIGVELCSYINSKGKYDFKPKTVENAAWVTKILMNKYKVPLSNVIRHYDVSHKMCPEPYVRDGKAWTAFKNRLKENYVEIKEDNEVVEKITVKINGKNYKADRILKENRNFICIKDFEQAGFEIGYDKETTIPSISNVIKDLPLIVDNNQTSVKAINVNDSNYIPIRGLAAATGTFSVDFKDGNVIVNTNKNNDNNTL